jgi:excisionase family DNA binding protein
MPPSEQASTAVVALLARVLDELVGLRADLVRQAPAPATEKDDPEALLDVKGAAARCGVSATTIYRASERGELRCMRAGARVRFTRADLDAWLRGERPDPARVLSLNRRSGP